MPKSDLSPASTGLRGRCPKCGEGALFDGFLTFAKRCEACGENFEIEDAGDGPAIFVILLVGIFVIPFALAFQLATNAPLWVTMLIWIPIIIAACLGLLRPLRGIMFALQWVNNAKEVRSEDFED